MATNYVQGGRYVTVTAPVGGCTSGTLYLIGGIYGVAQSTVSVGAEVVLDTEGVYTLPKTGGGGIVFAQGDPCYYNFTTGLATPTDDGTNRLIGSATAAAINAATSVRVRLNGICSESAGDLAGKIDKLASPVAGDVVTQAAGGGLQKGNVALANIPTMAAAGGAGNFVMTAAADKVLSDSGVTAANLVTEAAAASGADQIVTSAGASKVVKDSGVAIANIPTMAAAGGAGNLVQTAAADKALSDSGIPISGVVGNSTGDAAGADLVIASAGANKMVKATSIPTGNLPTMAAGAVGAGNVIQSAGADKSQSDSGVAVANIPTMASAASSSDLPILSAGANKTVETADFPLYLSQIILATNKAGIVHCLEVDVEGAAGTIGVFNANCPADIQIVDFHALCTAANAGGTAKLNDAFGGAGNDITDAVTMAAQDVLSRAATIVSARKTIAAGGSLSVVKNAAGDDGKVYIYFVAL